MQKTESLPVHCGQCTFEHRHSFTDIPFAYELPMGSPDIPEAEYVDLKHEPHTVTHWGQFKLLLGEIEFLAPYVHIPNLSIVYAGSSPGHHLKALVEMMPSTWEWYMFDERPCEVYSSGKDLLLEKVCGTVSVLYGNGDVPATPDMEQRMGAIKAKIRDAESGAMYMDTRKLAALKNTKVIKREARPNVHVYEYNLSSEIARDLFRRFVTRNQTEEDPQLLLISDIRTPFNRISEQSVLKDMDLQLKLVDDLLPWKATLKFKLPYSDGFSKKTVYIKGSLRYQPYAPRISHETRLVVGPDLKTTVSYDIEEYAKRMYHYQTRLRTSLYDLDDPVADPERHPHLVGNNIAVDHCYDCTLARKIAENFLGTSLGVLDLLEKLAKEVASVQLACGGGGMLDE